MLFPKIRNKTRMSALMISPQHCTGGSSQGNQTRGRNKQHLDLKGRKKTLFADMIVLCIENPKKSTKNYQRLYTNLEELQYS